MEEIHRLHACDPWVLDQLQTLLASTGWTHSQIQGQLTRIKQLIVDTENGTVVVMHKQGEVGGFAAAQFYPWNRLGQIHGLLVLQTQRRQGCASKLVAQIEAFTLAQNSRIQVDGVYVDVDTPTNNSQARKFYERVGYRQDYLMTDYYDDNQDGVTYLKLFKWTCMIEED